MSYLVLARKYRPQSFEDLAGQGHVAKTLANAISSGRVAHAFLFTGVRGVGKTTSARLLAKCLECVGQDGKATGPTPTPCQVCAPCREIAAGVDIDVQEIDGASYNGVDEVRRLQEGIAFRPARDRFKIYIVDEVHMLSNAAWNAFLKTLEEPPPHVKFIFATTEVHKVPVTILSRCQRYDFKLIGTQVIADRLREVLKLESISAEEAAVQTLSREAAGSMRDAMSLLDQVIAFSGATVTQEDVSRVLGVASRQVLHHLAAALVQGDAKRAVDVVDELAQQGYDLPHVSKDILRHLRDLVVAKVCGDDGRRLLDLADEEARDVYALASKTTADDLSRLFQGFSRSFDEINKSGQPRTTLEMTLVRLARRPPLLPLDELLSRIGDLEKRLNDGGGGGGPSRSPTPGGGGRGSSTSRGGGAVAVPFTPQGGGTHGALALAPRIQEAAPEEVRREVPVRPPLQAVPPPEPVLETTPTPTPVSGTVATTPPLDAFRAILARVAETKPGLRAVLEHATPREVCRERLTIAFAADSFFAHQASEPDTIRVLTAAARAHFGAPTLVKIETSGEERREAAPTIASVDLEARRTATEKARAAVEQHPLVQAALRFFEADLREVRLPDGQE